MLRPLAARGHRVTVWLSHPGTIEKSYEIDGVRVVPFQEGMDFAAHAQKADVLLSHFENVPLVAGLARANSKPLAVICHDNFHNSFHNAAGADLVVYNSEWIRRDGEIFYAGYPPEFLPKRSIVVRPPVLAEEYRTEPGDCVTLVNLNPDKGGELFWQIAAWTPEWHFLASAVPTGSRSCRHHGCPTARSSTGYPGSRCASTSTAAPASCSCRACTNPGGGWPWRRSPPASR